MVGERDGLVYELPGSGLNRCILLAGRRRRVRRRRSASAPCPSTPALRRRPRRWRRDACPPLPRSRPRCGRRAWATRRPRRGRGRRRGAAPRSSKTIQSISALSVSVPSQIYDICHDDDAQSALHICTCTCTCTYIYLHARTCTRVVNSFVRTHACACMHATSI